MPEFRCIWYLPEETEDDPALAVLLADCRAGRVFLKDDPRPVEAIAVGWADGELVPVGSGHGMKPQRNGESSQNVAPQRNGESSQNVAPQRNGEAQRSVEQQRNGEAQPDSEGLLLITATDRGLSYAKEHNIAAVAYANPRYPNETLSGAEFVVEGFEEFGIEELNRAYRRWHALPWEILTTKRCLVRELTLPDLKALYRLYDDDEIRRFVEPLFDFEEEYNYERAYIDSVYRFYGYGMWLVFEKKTGKLIGRAGLEQREYPDGVEIEMGYLIDKNYRRQGYATEVCLGIMKYARNYLGMDRISCLIRKDNTASIRFAEKTGFVCRGETELDQTAMFRYVAEL